MNRQVKIALVTGGASGIGEALCIALALQGALVCVTDRDILGAQRVADAIIARGLQAEAIALDVTDPDEFQRVIDDIFAQHGRLDWLFNNAGVGLAGATEDLALTDWRRIIDVNLWGVIHGVAAVYPHMIAQGFGHIINTASGAGLAPRPGMTAYATAKAAVVSLTTSLRPEAALHHVQISAACPGYIATNIMKSTQYVGIDPVALIEKIPIKPLTAEACARAILRGTDRNMGIIPISKMVWADWLLYRASPRLSMHLATWRARQFQKVRTR